MNKNYAVVTYAAYALVLGFIVGLFFLLGLGTAHARVTSKTTPPVDAKHRNDTVVPLGVVTNPDNTQTLTIYACGSMVEITVDLEDLQVQNPEIEKAAMNGIRNACTGI